MKILNSRFSQQNSLKLLFFLLTTAFVVSFTGQVFGETILPPLKQVDSVEDIHDVECKPHLTLVFKDISWDPACVKHSSVDKLVERGGASDHDPHQMMMK